MMSSVAAEEEERVLRRRGEEEAVVHVFGEEGLLFVAEVFLLVPGGLEVLGLEGGVGCGRVGGGGLAGHGLDLLEKVEVEFAEGNGFVKFLRLEKSSKSLKTLCRRL